MHIRDLRVCTSTCLHVCLHVCTHTIHVRTLVYMERHYVASFYRTSHWLIVSMHFVVSCTSSFTPLFPATNCALQRRDCQAVLCGNVETIISPSWTIYAVPWSSTERKDVERSVRIELHFSKLTASAGLNETVLTSLRDYNERFQMRMERYWGIRARSHIQRHRGRNHRITKSAIVKIGVYLMRYRILRENKLQEHETWISRDRLTPIIRTGVTLCSFCSYIHNPGPCILGGWSLCVEWASVVAKIAPQDSFWHILL